MSHRASQTNFLSFAVLGSIRALKDFGEQNNVYHGEPSCRSLISCVPSIADGGDVNVAGAHSD